MKVNVTTSIDPEIWQKAKDENLSWSDALEFGIKFLIAEKDGFDYPANKLSNRIAFLSAKISELSQQIEDLKSEKKVDPVDIEKEVEEVFKDVRTTE